MGPSLTFPETVFETDCVLVPPLSLLHPAKEAINSAAPTKPKFFPFMILSFPGMQQILVLRIPKCEFAFSKQNTPVKTVSLLKKCG